MCGCLLCAGVGADVFVCALRIWCVCVCLCVFDVCVCVCVFDVCVCVFGGVCLVCVCVWCVCVWCVCVCVFGVCVFGVCVCVFGVCVFGVCVCLVCVFGVCVFGVCVCVYVCVCMRVRMSISTYDTRSSSVVCLICARVHLIGSCSGMLQFCLNNEGSQNAFMCTISGYSLW